MHLRHYLSHAAKRGFKWGEHDCILFSAGWVMNVSGRDPAQPWRGTYRNEAEGKALLERCGGMATCIAEALAHCGWREVVLGQEMTAPGDIVLVERVDWEGGQAAGIAVDRGRVALLTKLGLVVGPGAIIKAWRMGNDRG